MYRPTLLFYAARILQCRDQIVLHALINLPFCFKDDIHDEYISQELKREWNQYKHRVVVDTINSTGVRPGYGKWAK